MPNDLESEFPVHFSLVYDYHGIVRNISPDKMFFTVIGLNKIIRWVKSEQTNKNKLNLHTSEYGYDDDSCSKTLLNKFPESKDQLALWNINIHWLTSAVHSGGQSFRIMRPWGLVNWKEIEISFFLTVWVWISLRTWNYNYANILKCIFTV